MIRLPCYSSYKMYIFKQEYKLLIPPKKLFVNFSFITLQVKNRSFQLRKFNYGFSNLEELKFYYCMLF